MKDITGRVIKKGDILAVGQRSGNSGDLDIRIVKDIVERPNPWREGDFISKIKTTTGGYLQIPEKTIIISEDTFKGTKLEKWVREQLLVV